MNASQQIDNLISSLDDWRGPVMSQIRLTINSAHPDLVEEWKWDTGVWTYNKKLICAFSYFKDHVKVNFFNGASLPDPHKIINNGLTSKTHRAIDIAQEDVINYAALTQMVNAAIDYQVGKK